MLQSKMEVQGVVRGHHAYKCIWSYVIGEELSVISQDSNEHDFRAIAVMNDGQIISHVPCELSRIFISFSLLKASHGLTNVHVGIIQGQILFHLAKVIMTCEYYSNTGNNQCAGTIPGNTVIER